MDSGEDKIVLDPIHGMIHLDPLAVKIIDTRYFQRLRYIKQLSFADFVYPGATHTRFAHSIGVYHLARQMIKEIKAHKLPAGAAKMTALEEKCVCIAALCHDLGHGPFSHIYQAIAKEVLVSNDSDIEHENISMFLVEKMFNDTQYKLKQYLGKNDKTRGKNIDLIKQLIKGKKEEDMSPEEKKKKYMFQIVSNADTGVDVDKWDYFHRDAKACGVPDRFQYDRALSVARVVKVKDKEVFELGYRDQDAFTFYNLFNTRFTMHRKICKHKVVKAIDLMVKDVFKLVQEQEHVVKKNSKIVLFPIKSGVHVDGKDMRLMPLGGGKYLDIEEYLKLRDDVLLKIQDSTTRAYEPARNLMQRILERKLYKLVDVKICLSETEVENFIQIMAPIRKRLRKRPVQDAADDKIMAPIRKRLRKRPVQDAADDKIKEPIPKHSRKRGVQDEADDKIKELIQKRLEDEDLQDEADVMVVRINYGQKKYDPVEKLNFYSKGSNEGKTLKRDEVSPVLPNVFQEYHVRVYSKFSTTEKDNKIRNILEDVRNQIPEQRHKR